MLHLHVQLTACNIANMYRYLLVHLVFITIKSIGQRGHLLNEHGSIKLQVRLFVWYVFYCVLLHQYIVGICILLTLALLQYVCSCAPVLSQTNAVKTREREREREIECLSVLQKQQSSKRICMSNVAAAMMRGESRERDVTKCHFGLQWSPLVLPPPPFT